MGIPFVSPEGTGGDVSKAWVSSCAPRLVCPLPVGWTSGRAQPLIQLVDMPLKGPRKHQQKAGGGDSCPGRGRASGAWLTAAGPSTGSSRPA